MAASRSEKQAAPAKKPGRLSTLRQIFTITRESDPLLPLWMLLAFAGTVLLAFLLGLALGHPIYLAVLGVPLGVLLALILMSRRAERFAYARASGQTGVTGQVMKNIRRGWYVEEEPVAIDPRTRDLVFRAVGRPGVALIAEGPVGRATRLAEGERKRVTRVLGTGVPVHVVLAGDEEGQVPIRKI